MNFTNFTKSTTFDGDSGIGSAEFELKFVNLQDLDAAVKS
jgi:hypothetical protein